MKKVSLETLFDTNYPATKDSVFTIEAHYVKFQLVRLPEYEDRIVYRVDKSLYFKNFSKFMDHAVGLCDKRSVLPKPMRLLSGDKCGNSLNWVERPKADQSHNDYAVYRQAYKPGKRLRPIGYDTNSLENYLSFVRVVCEKISSLSEIYHACKADGPFYLDFAGVSPFYPALFAGVKAGVDMNTFLSDVENEAFFKSIKFRGERFGRDEVKALFTFVQDMDE